MFVVNLSKSHGVKRVQYLVPLITFVISRSLIVGLHDKNVYIELNLINFVFFRENSFFNIISYGFVQYVHETAVRTTTITK